MVERDLWWPWQGPKFASSGSRQAESRQTGGSFSKEKYENSTLNKETREIRGFLIYSYFYLKKMCLTFLTVFGCYFGSRQAGPQKGK